MNYPKNGNDEKIFLNSEKNFEEVKRKGGRTKGEIPNKDIILEIYEDVYNDNKTPRPIDYAKKIYEYRHKNDDVKLADDNIDKEVAKQRVSVMKALKQLTEGNDPVLGVIDKYYYVPIRIVNERKGYFYLLNNLHPAKDHVLSLSKKMCIIALDEDAYISREEKAELEEDSSCMEAELTADLNDNTKPQEILPLVNALKDKIEKLQNKIDGHDGRDIIDNLKLYIGADKCYNISKNQNNIVIMFDLNDQDIKDDVHKKLYKKINDLIKEIWNKPVPPMRLTKKE